MLRQLCRGRHALLCGGTAQQGSRLCQLQRRAHGRAAFLRQRLVQQGQALRGGTLQHRLRSAQALVFAPRQHIQRGQRVVNFTAHAVVGAGLLGSLGQCRALASHRVDGLTVTHDPDLRTRILHLPITQGVQKIGNPVGLPRRHSSLHGRNPLAAVAIGHGQRLLGRQRHGRRLPQHEGCNSGMQTLPQKAQEG